MGCGNSKAAAQAAQPSNQQYKNAEEVFRERLGPEFVRRFSQNSLQIERRMSNPNLLSQTGSPQPKIRDSLDEDQKLLDPEPKLI
mmetsp:Transcript_27944/g.56606  ORF Transcript_27944/g.56606 Transcript_27944/m.56606 type:complete len:85 (-) Transcript_27944:672-926(-)